MQEKQVGFTLISVKTKPFGAYLLKELYALSINRLERKARENGMRASVCPHAALMVAIID